MKRRKFLSNSSALSVATLIPVSTLFCASKAKNNNGKSLFSGLSSEEYNNFLNQVKFNLEEKGIDPTEILYRLQPKNILTKSAKGNTCTYINNAGSKVAIANGAVTLLI